SVRHINRRPRVAKLDEEKHMERTEKESFRREEIAGQNLIFVVGHEMAPAGRAASFRSARNAVSSQNGTDGLIAECNAQFGKFASDSGVAPASIFACQSHNQLFNCLMGTGTTTLPRRRIGPLTANELTMPFEDG